MEKQIKYPFKAKDEQGQVYVFNKTDGKVEITLPEGVRQQAGGDGLVFIARMFNRYQLKLLVDGKLSDILRPANLVLAYTVLYGKNGIIRIADNVGNLFESRGKFRFVNTETYESSAMLPEDRSYLIGNLLAAYTNR